MSSVNPYLLPLSALYRAGVAVRSYLFDCGMLKSHSFGLPVICVGNITVGGTGKTPHTEMLLRLLEQEGLSVAVLSRGYGRRTRGYVLAGDDATARSIGDEPMQMHIKFPKVTVAVCERRAVGIARLTATASPQAIVLDDAFQHRYVTAGLNIVLVDSNRPVYDDALLPAGRLREPVTALERAHIIIVTKCPAGMNPIDYRVIQQKLNLQPWQKLFFTTMTYGQPYTIFGQPRSVTLTSLRTREHIMLLSGIARPEQLRNDMAPYCARITQLQFADHHHFRRKDVARINSTFRDIPADDKIILTTEKDAARLRSVEGLSEDVKKALFVLPMQAVFLRDEEQAFKDCITDFVNSNM